MKDLKDKVIFLTGAGSGIGRATAIEFARAGTSSLILNDINMNGLKETASIIEGLGRKSFVLPADVSDYNAVREMVRTAFDSLGRIDILVNVAGTAMPAPLEEMGIEDWRKVIGVNLYGALNTVQCVYSHMLERGSGHIVNIASIGGLFALHPYNAAYYVSKFGVVGFSEALMLESSMRGIHVTCVCPGGVKTSIYDTSTFKGLSEGARQQMKKLLLASAEEPEDTARAIVDAVKKNKFLITTTKTAKLAYFLRRHFSFLWFFLMKKLADWFVKNFDKYKTQGRSGLPKER
ncbi:butyryl-CoA dehydrogenase [Desulfosalsimonas propionicica]|uniref:Butyryl-CoA dehydrogenase n=1 Tax=Desulfosalsimonas propionicica TaxID=332175 RepID=A0A7W0HM73_9BACT|nr:butyryl-CoA dehydrogenase [Desulfosalsimonas propionicica]